MDVVTNDELTEKIMKDFEKENETKEEFQENRIRRIEKLCEIAVVDYNEYIKALGIAKIGSKVKLARDIDELNINPFNVEWIQAWDGNMDIQ